MALEEKGKVQEVFHSWYSENDLYPLWEHPPCMVWMFSAAQEINEIEGSSSGVNFLFCASWLWLGFSNAPAEDQILPCYRANKQTGKGYKTSCASEVFW